MEWKINILKSIICWQNKNVDIRYRGYPSNPTSQAISTLTEFYRNLFGHYCGGAAWFRQANMPTVTFIILVGSLKTSLPISTKGYRLLLLETLTVHKFEVILLFTETKLFWNQYSRLTRHRHRWAGNPLARTNLD